MARLEYIRLLIAFAAHKGFRLFWMDVKTTFLNGLLKEEIFIQQPPGFEDKHNPEHVYNLEKDMCGLKQDPRVWYDMLSQFLRECGYRREVVDKTLFLLKKAKIHWLFK